VRPTNIGADTDEFWDVNCTLAAGSDNDHASESNDPSDDWHFGRSGTLTMIVTHEFASVGSATVDCNDGGDQSGPSDLSFQSLVIAASRWETSSCRSAPPRSVEGRGRRSPRSA
jgi:hypothetical protein